ncbi:MAG: response regulator transcription factor [Chloroflexi bacterium]|nr:response regulator transcription factor [Chloroflexota bacterium]
MKVLVLESNPIATRDVHFCLKVRWPDVVVLNTKEGQRAIDLVETESPDLVIAASKLPDMDTGDFISRVRNFSDVPLIVLAQGESDMDRVRFLEAGADDCISLPFSPIELLTKVRVLLRRTWGLGFNMRNEQPFSVGDRLTINAGTREVTVEDRPVRLTPIEYRVLLELARNQGKVVSHEMLLERAWGNEYISEVGFTKRYVYRLRQKLENGAAKPLIVSERGVGYRLVRAD